LIPQQDLEKLTPLSDMVKRAQMVKRKSGKNPYRKGHNVLTKRERQIAYYPANSAHPGYLGPKGSIWQGTPKKEDRK